MDRSSHVTHASAATCFAASRAHRALRLLAALALVAVLLLALCAPASAKKGGKKGAVQAPPPPAPSVSYALPAPPSAWTFMIYLDGDNDLDPWGRYTIDLMAQGLAAGDFGNVAIPVLYDHFGSCARAASAA